MTADAVLKIVRRRGKQAGVDTCTASTDPLHTRRLEILRDYGLEIDEAFYTRHMSRTSRCEEGYCGPMTYSIAVNFEAVRPGFAQLIEQIGPCQLGSSQQNGTFFLLTSESNSLSTLHKKPPLPSIDGFSSFILRNPFKALDILNTREEVLRKVGVSRPKIIYLKDATKVLSGLPTLEELSNG